MQSYDFIFLNLYVKSYGIMEIWAAVFYGGFVHSPAFDTKNIYWNAIVFGPGNYNLLK